MTDVAVLLDALRRWRGHENDNAAAIDTLLAVFGGRSPLGRFASHGLLPRPSMIGLWLYCDICDYCDYRVLIDEANAAYGYINGERPRSDAAARMIDHGLPRKTGRGPAGRLPLTPEARAALLMYFREEIELLREIVPLVCKGGDAPWHRDRRVCRQRAINRRIATTEKALKAIEDAGVWHKPAKPSKADHAVTGPARHGDGDWVPSQIASRQFVKTGPLRELSRPAIGVM